MLDLSIVVLLCCPKAGGRICGVETTLLQRYIPLPGRHPRQVFVHKVLTTWTNWLTLFLAFGQLLHHASTINPDTDI